MRAAEWIIVALQLIGLAGLFAFLLLHSWVVRGLLQDLARIVKELQRGSRDLERRIDRYYEEERDGRREGTTGAEGTQRTKGTGEAD